MKEDFLHFVWQYQLYNNDNNSQNLEIKHPGYYNSHEGPDYLHAKIMQDGIEWNGHVEIHLKSSDWLRHNHINNSHYQSIILHVVYENDVELHLPCPTLVLKDKIHKNIHDQYINWIQNIHDIPCAHSGLKDISKIYRIQWIDRLIVDRCDMKYNEWLSTYHQVQNNWKQMIWIKVAESFGMKYNNVGFRHLAMNVDVGNLEKLDADIEMIEAYLFGVSGLIPQESRDDYVQKIENNYAFIQTKFPQNTDIKIPWNFLRMRPANFPTIRIAQLAKFICTITPFPQQLLSTKLQVKDWEKLLNIEVSEYWKSHYTFGKESRTVSKKLGKTAIDAIIINAIIPLHYFHGKIFNEPTSISHAFHLLQQVKPESNSIIERWQKFEHFPENAYDSQSYIHLYNHYCTKKKCASCLFGQKILIK